MTKANVSFADTVKAYPEFKVQFEKFCEEATTRLNKNPELPGVTFAYTAGDALAKLHALDRTFDVSLRLQRVNNMPIGLVLVHLFGESKEPIYLFHTYFDNLGNVRAAPNGDAGLDSLFSVRYVESFTNRVLQEYFTYLSKSLPTSA